MSEMLMFQQKEVDGKSYSAEEGYGAISGTLDLTSEQIKQYLCGPTDSGCTAGREPSVNVHSIIATDSTNQYAVSVALGVPLVGIDATVNILDNLYATGVLTADLQGQFIIQQRLLDGNPVGWSVGLQFSGEKWAIANANSNNFIPDNQPTTNIGIRSVLMLTPILDYGDRRPLLYLTGSYNYHFGSNSTYPKVGIALGIY